MAGLANDQRYYQPSAAPAAAGPSRARRLFGLTILAGVLYLLYLIQSQRVEYFTVTSDSMSPTLQVGETYLMKPTEDYLHGQIVVLLSPLDHGTRLVKRLVATGGDRVALRDGFLYVNGQRNSPPQGVGPPIDLSDQSWVIAPDQVFVVGDNRPYSHDSREFGPVPRSDLLGVLDPTARGNAWWRKLL